MCVGACTRFCYLVIILTFDEYNLRLQVIDRFYEIRQQCLNGFCEDGRWEDKCECLLQDSPEMWEFNDRGETSTSKYIVSSDNLL